MAEKPSQIEYHTGVLGGIFRAEDLDRLDKAYIELLHARLIEKAGVAISFFGKPKSLMKITEQGLLHVRGEAA